MKGKMETDSQSKIKTSILVEKNQQEIWDTLTTISNYRSWNPVVTHAVMYGPPRTGTRIKMRSGKWDLQFVIVEISPPYLLDIEGGGVGLKIKTILRISPDIDGSRVRIEASVAGWLTKLFPGKFKRGIEESFDMFLTALRRRVTSDNSYEIVRSDEKNGDQDHLRSPTPFNLIYKTRKKKSRRGRSRLR